jgi:hypothetical protein
VGGPTTSEVRGADGNFYARVDATVTIRNNKANATSPPRASQFFVMLRRQLTRHCRLSPGGRTVHLDGFCAVPTFARYGFAEDAAPDLPPGESVTLHIRIEFDAPRARTQDWARFVVTGHGYSRLELPSA